jgi:hypothetical protein
VTYSGKDGSKSTYLLFSTDENGKEKQENILNVNDIVLVSER